MTCWNMLTSHSIRVRWLKYDNYLPKRLELESHSIRVRWLKYLKNLFLVMETPVALHTSALIEMNDKTFESAVPCRSHSIRVRWLKFLKINTWLLTLNSRTPYECVDWNSCFKVFDLLDYGRTPYECVDWNSPALVVVADSAKVALHTSALIEIFFFMLFHPLLHVALHTSALIEISFFLRPLYRSLVALHTSALIEINKERPKY